MISTEAINVTELYGSGNLPLGILSIDAYIRHMNPNVETRIIDFNTVFMKYLERGEWMVQLKCIVEDFDAFLQQALNEQWHDFEPQVVILSTLFDKSIPNLFKVSHLIKKMDPSVTLIAGGHPTNNLYESILTNEECVLDAICLGEGELPISELLKADDFKKHFRENDIFKTKEKCQKGEAKTFQKFYIENLDDIPLYNYQGFLEQYGEEVLCFHNNVLDSEHSFNKQAVIMTSRGCPYQCIFCASQNVHGRAMRANSLERVKGEIDFWIDQYQVKTIGIMDDHFLFDVDRAIAIIDYIGSRGIDVRFLNGLAIAPINEKFVACLVRNAVKEVHLALESGSDRVLREIIHKPLSIEKARAVLNLFNDAAIFVKIYLVVGFPDETLEDIEASLQFLRTANFHWALISSPTPISGSALMNQLIENSPQTALDFSKISFFNSDLQNKEAAEKMNNDIRYTVNLDINFVNNPYMRMGKYHLALQRFESVIKNYPDHAFAHYFLVKCHEKLGSDSACFIESKREYNRRVVEDPFWLKYAAYFGLDLEL